MSDNALIVIYKAAVVLAKILHTIPAWWRFTTASDRQRTEAIVRRGDHLRFYQRDDPNIAQLLDDMGDTCYCAA